MWMRTAGSCRWRTGANWAARKNGMGDVTVFSLAVHPLDPRILYASAWLSSEGKVTVFKSVDAGSNWTPTAFRMSWMNSMLNRGMPLALDPTSVDRVYVGTPIGLFQTMDGGNTWTKVPELGSVGILALATGSDGNRTSVYVSTPGGMVSGLAPTVKSASTAATYIPAGVLKLTSILHGPGGTLYLPLVSR